MRILITGGAGFIGSWLAERLLSEGNEVVVIDDLSTGNFKNIEHLTANPRFRCVIDSVLNETVLEELVKQCDCVYHLAAAVGVRLVIEQPSKTIETNILGVHSVLKLCARFHKKVLVTSTSEVYGKGTNARFNEEDECVIGLPRKKRWSYAASKAIEEYLAYAYFYEKGLPVVIVRLFNTVGPRQTGRYGMVMPSFVANALAGRDIVVHGDGCQTRSFMAVSDCVTALAALMTHPKAVGEIFNIGGEREISMNELAALVIRLAGSSSALRHVSYLEAYGEEFEDMPRRVPDITKLKALTGFAPSVSLEDIITGMIARERNTA